MRKSLTVGIIRETKAGEKRAPLTPADAGWLRKRMIEIEVESSADRIFKDTEYRRHGANIVDTFKKASLFIGIKEPRLDTLRENKVYMVFSHTIKGQCENMPLLRECIKKGVTLVDYEKITDRLGRRIVYFGRFAGICGLVDSLYYFGRRLECKGIDNPFSGIRPAHRYSSLIEVKNSLRRAGLSIRGRGFDKKLSPFILGVTGHGHVNEGLDEVLELLNPIEVHPRDISTFARHQRYVCNRIYKIGFHREEKFRSEDGSGFYIEDYLKNPKKFKSNLDIYLPYLNILIHTGYWDRRFPRLVTKKMVRKLCRRKVKLEFIGDISCDLKGAIELNYKATDIDNPTYTYNPERDSYTDGYKQRGITILARDNLPAELPRDASRDFSERIRDYVYQIAAHGVTDITNHIAIPREIRQAVIVQNGRLAAPYHYLKKSL